MKRIVVGADGSAGAEIALRWAIDEAALHGASVVAILAYDYLNQHHLGGADSFDASYGATEAREALHIAVGAVDSSRHVEEQVVLDLPARALIEASADADLLVVGSRGLGGFKGLLLGSVSERVLELARCPVAVVPEEGLRRSDGAVVIGIDAGTTSPGVLRWAAREARARNATLRVVHAWQPPYLEIPGSDQTGESAKAAAHDVVRIALEDPAVSELHVESHVPCSGAAAALLGFAAGASLIAVGSRGLGRFGGVLLGSTSRQLAHHAPCPVVVIPTGD